MSEFSKMLKEFIYINIIRGRNLMSTKNKSIINLKSSEKLFNFLESTHLHKKDFAQMIGVTLSYVYNLIDNAIPFSTRNPANSG